VAPITSFACIGHHGSGRLTPTGCPRGLHSGGKMGMVERLNGAEAPRWGATDEGNRGADERNSSPPAANWGFSRILKFIEATEVL